MKFRILLDNYYSYLLIYGALTIISFFFFNEKISYGSYFILSLLWFTDLIFEKKRYLLNAEITETDIKITYLNIFLKEKKYIIEKDLIQSTYYQKNNQFINYFDLLIINEKKSNDNIKFKIFDKDKKDVETKFI